jgi:pectate lyase
MFVPLNRIPFLSRLFLLVVSPALLALPSCASDGPPIIRANTNPKPSPLVEWPKPTGEVELDATKRVRDHFDGKMQRFYGVDDLGTSGQDEDQFPLFRLSDGAVLENVIIGDPAADGIHCYGSCTLKNVWFERVGEDAATFRGQKDSDVMIIDGGGASGAKDKVFQNNGIGTMVIKNYYFEHFGKLYRSCGNCSRQAGRTVIFENVTAVIGKKTHCLAGINENYGDVAIFRGINQFYASEKPEVPPCQKYIGNAKGLEPKKSSVGADGKYCFYDDSTVKWHL